MAAFQNQENRALKTKGPSRLGEPDIYPQDSNQPEDELTQASVKHGFASTLSSQVDEHATARNYSFSVDKCGTFFCDVVNKKLVLNTINDGPQAKKRAPISKDIFWHVQSTKKQALDAWMNGLKGSKTLHQLLKRVPLFNKKDELYTSLCEHGVPMQRASWYLKVCTAYIVAQQETKAKKRQIFDPLVEWTSTLSRYLKDQLTKLHDYPTSGTFMTAGAAGSSDSDTAMKLWTYGCNLAHHLYEEGLLDRHDFLLWLLDIFDKYKNGDESIFKQLISFTLRLLSEIASTEILARKLSHIACWKLAQMAEENCDISRSQSPATGVVPEPTAAPSLHAVLLEFMNCPQHRSVVLSLSTIVQTVVIRCPSALIWHDMGSSCQLQQIQASPLDLLPCVPSLLPMAPGPDNPEIRKKLRMVEEQIRQRSIVSENRWTVNKTSNSNGISSRVLSVLAELDRTLFERNEDTVTIVEALCDKIFSCESENEEEERDDNSVVRFLCEWATCTQRTGVHRAVIVAKVLERRMVALANQAEKDTTKSEMDTEDGPAVPMCFQNVLFEFLDQSAPTPDEDPKAFQNLVHLFAELIRNEVVSHDSYTATLISRGDLATFSSFLGRRKKDDDDVERTESHTKANDTADEIKMEIEPDDIFGFKEERASPGDPSSVKSGPPSSTPTHTPGALTPGGHTPGMVHTPYTPVRTPGASTPGALTPGASVTPGGGVPTTPGVTSQSQRPPPPAPEPSRPVSKHVHYVINFPIPFEEDYSHEINQRMISLYGVGKAREEAQHVQKKVRKDLVRLFNKKNCLDVVTGVIFRDKKRREKDEISHDSIFRRYAKLSYYDMYQVTNSCAECILQQIREFHSGQHVYLPVIDNVLFFLDLMEHACSIHNLLDFSIQLLNELTQVEYQLGQRKSPLCGSFTTQLCLCVVAHLRKFHAYLLVSQEQTALAFERLCARVKHVTKPSDCSSAERCILAYLYELYTSCSYVKGKYFEFFNSAISQLQKTLYEAIQPSISNLKWDQEIFKGFFDSPRVRTDPIVQQLNESESVRYNFVCNAIMQIIYSSKPDRLNQVALMCAEMTACCNALSSEWLGVVKALCCCTSHNHIGYQNVLEQVELLRNQVNDRSLHEKLAVFTSILIARHCFSLDDLVVHVALHSLLAACPHMHAPVRLEDNQRAEAGARLTCHILLNLFVSTQALPQVLTQINRGDVMVRSSCDRHLLEAAHNSITPGAVVAVLKALLMLGESNKRGLQSQSKADFNSILGAADKEP